MRVAVVSDIHGNLTALDAVVADIQRCGVDAAVHGGDLALMGPRPGEVVDRIRELGWRGVVGNTDELLWRPGQRETQLQRAPALADHLRLLFDVYADDTRQRLGDERLAWLAKLPAERRLGGLSIVHAAPGNLWRAPMPDADDAELRDTYWTLDAACVVYGHIHRPFVRDLNELVVANSGSVGMPWDGDPRAAYLIIEDGKPSVIHVAYDIEAEVRALHNSRHPDGPRLAEMRRRGRFLRGGDVAGQRPQRLGPAGAAFPSGVRPPTTSTPAQGDYRPGP
jgi:predicted phosphodiesterase